MSIIQWTSSEPSTTLLTDDRVQINNPQFYLQIRLFVNGLFYVVERGLLQYMKI